MATPADDTRWMARALAVAASVRGTTRPNPFVGAVVIRDGPRGAPPGGPPDSPPDSSPDRPPDRIEVGAGATGPAGTAHAEVRALADAGDRARGATLVVTLEPCAHTGRTPPCTDAILRAGVRRVVVGLRDPNPVAAGGVDRLRAAGIEVTTGVLADEVAAQQAVFLSVVDHGRPHVTLKLAQVPDGRTRPDRVGRRWLTGPVARRRVHRLRAAVDAVLVGSGTALADDPALTVRDAAPGPRPPRPVVFDRRGRLPLDRRVVRPGAIVVTAATADRDWRRALARRGVTVVVADSLRTGLAALPDLDVTAVLAEPGTTLGRALVADGLVDRLLLHVAGTTVADDRPWTPAVPTGGLRLVARRRLGDDVEWDLHRVRPPDPRDVRHEQDAGRDVRDPADGDTAAGTARRAPHLPAPTPADDVATPARR